MKAATRRQRRLTVRPDLCSGCLSCQLVCSFLFTGAFNPLKARIEISWSGDMDRRVALTDECTGCGACVEYCNYGALSLEP